MKVEFGEPGTQRAQESGEIVKMEVSSPQLQPGEPLEPLEDGEAAGELVLVHEQHLLDVGTHLGDQLHLLGGVEEVDLTGPEIFYPKSWMMFLLVSFFPGDPV